MSKKRGNSPFEVGYKKLRKKLEKRNKYVMSCRSCGYFYQDEKAGEKYELCHNGNVTEFDMVQTPTNFYCTYWVHEVPEEGQPVSPRSRLEDFAEKRFYRR